MYIESIKYILYLFFIYLKVQYDTNIKMILILKYGIFQIYIFCIYIIVEFFYFFFPEVRMECFRKRL